MEYSIYRTPLDGRTGVQRWMQPAIREGRVIIGWNVWSRPLSWLNLITIARCMLENWVTNLPPTAHKLDCSRCMGVPWWSVIWYSFAAVGRPVLVASNSGRLGWCAIMSNDWRGISVKATEILYRQVSPRYSSMKSTSARHLSLSEWKHGSIFDLSGKMPTTNTCMKILLNDRPDICQKLTS